jgi:hypothetical protein
MNDGGMFYVMVKDLQNNGLFLPAYTSYNLSQIPYAYPPLSFYTAAVFNQVLNFDLVSFFRIYPLFFNILSIPAFFLLAHEITNNYRQALLSTGFYAVLLPGFEWLITGGGLTRSPSHTFFILSLYLFLKFLRTRDRKDFIFSTLAASLMTLHHIEYLWLLAISLIAFSIKPLKWKNAFLTLTVFFGGVALITSPYWISILSYHGLSPFIAAFSAGDFNPAMSLSRLLLMMFTQETITNYVNVLAIIGLFYCVFARKWEILTWFVLIIFLKPRSAERSLIFPVVIFAAIVLDEIIYPALDKIYKAYRYSDESSSGDGRKRKFHIPNFGLIFLTFSILYPFYLGFFNTTVGHPTLSSISKSEIQAMEWVSDNTPTDSKFIVMSPESKWSIDRVAEWFPALAGRKSLITAQGSEWLQDGDFEARKILYHDLKACMGIGEPCLEAWRENNKMDFSHIYLTKTDCTQFNEPCLNFFAATLVQSEKYITIFENEDSLIFSRK